MPTVLERVIGRQKLIFESGRLAGQAHGAVTVRCGDTVILATAVMSESPRPNVDFLPLTVDYEERLYSAGKIPGSFFRREGRPGQNGILAARLTDRSIRPLFAKVVRNDIQITITVLSADQENPPEILGMVGASAALSISQIPFSGPIGVSRVAYNDGQFLINPTYKQESESQLSLVVTSTRDAIIMIEGGSDQISEEIILESIRHAQEANLVVIDLIDELTKLIGKPKNIIDLGTEESERLEAQIDNKLSGRLAQIVESTSDKPAREEALNQLKNEVTENLTVDYSPEQIAIGFKGVLRREVRRRILEQGIRPDGRTTTEIRPISCEVGLLPRTHGSGLFNRGQTQVLSTVTLASTGMRQRLDTIGPDNNKLFMHHYNFPSYSTGEARRVGSPGRREIGHGALAERAILPALPSEAEFPYAIRVVSEALSSNGSTSMGSVCGATLALMDAGVPIKTAVAGIAMGLVTENTQFAILSDIQGIEDALGDMDFKVAGTSKGINAIQMDVKGKGLTEDLLRQALEQARVGRLHILGKMEEAITQPRSELSPHAPKMLRLQIPVDKIGALIGPGGRIIRAIIEETGATIDVEDDGTVIIGAPSGSMLEHARGKVEGLTRELVIGDVFTGKVTRVTNFGMFVELTPGREGLVRSGDLGDTEDGFKVGQEITVMIQEIDSQGRLNLSRRALLANDGEQSQRPAPQSRPPFDRGQPRPNGPSFQDRGRRPGSGGGSRRPGGPDRRFFSTGGHERH
jgi:polyribonucleotide nucleotidyltransferase